MFYYSRDCKCEYHMAEELLKHWYSWIYRSYISIMRQVLRCYLALNRNAESTLKLPKMLDTVTWRINQWLVIEVVRESLKEVLRYIMYYNFCFYLALILNRSWFAVKSLFKFLAFSNIVHQYLMHHFMIVLLWINIYYITYYSASGLMLVD